MRFLQIVNYFWNYKANVNAVNVPKKNITGTAIKLPTESLENPEIPCLEVHPLAILPPIIIRNLYKVN